VLQSVFILIFLVGSLAAYAGLARKIDPRLGGGMALASFALLTPSAFDIIVISNGSRVIVTMAGVGFLCAGLALTALLFTFAAATGRVSRTQSQSNASRSQPQPQSQSQSESQSNIQP
jgi:hypothetical protein